jgi:hypothetical protein
VRTNHHNYREKVETRPRFDDCRDDIQTVLKGLQHACRNLPLFRSVVSFLPDPNDPAIWEDPALLRAVRNYLCEQNESGTYRYQICVVIRWEALMDHNAPGCDVCKAERNLGPVVYDDVWRALCANAQCDEDVQMCQSCMEKHLGRALAKADFEWRLPWNLYRAIWSIVRGKAPLGGRSQREDHILI